MEGESLTSPSEIEHKQSRALQELLDFKIEMCKVPLHYALQISDMQPSGNVQSLSECFEASHLVCELPDA